MPIYTDYWGVEWEWNWNWDEGWDWDYESLYDDVPDTKKARSLMNAAGRLDSTPFADLRSASYAHRRAKKYPRKKSRSRSKRYCCPICRPALNLSRLARSEDIKHHIHAEPWHDDNAADIRHGEVLEFADDIWRYELFGHKKSQFENTEVGEDGWAQSGEDFGAWGRRRIEQMRAVKEDRIRRRNTKDTTPPSTPTATTLPTSSLDIYAHNLLDNVLRRFIHSFKSPRCGPYSFPPFIKDFTWFGEYAWQWHRNQSGCWELGYALEDCKGETIRNNWTWLGCFCKDFALDEPAPEDIQRCSLVEWVQGPLWDMMVKEEYKRLLCQAEDDKNVHSEAQGWEMMSAADAASEGWSVVEGEVV